MNRQTFIDTLRRALYGRVSDYELADHIRYYEDYIQQEIMKGRSEQEVLGELGDPRLIARTILETSGLETPNVEYTIDERRQRGFRLYVIRWTDKGSCIYRMESGAGNGADCCGDYCDYCDGTGTVYLSVTGTVDFLAISWL